jgi:hypothetical protein
MISQPQELSKLGCTLEAAIEAAAKAVIGLRDDLNEWDGKAGDGDCGTTVRNFYLLICFLYDCMVLSEFFVCRCIEVQVLFLKI